MVWLFRGIHFVKSGLSLVVGGVVVVGGLSVVVGWLSVGCRWWPVVNFCTGVRIPYYGNHFLYCGKNSVLRKSLSVLWEEFCTTEITFCTVGRILHYGNHFLYCGKNSVRDTRKHVSGSMIICTGAIIVLRIDDYLYWGNNCLPDG